VRCQAHPLPRDPKAVVVSAEAFIHLFYICMKVLFPQSPPARPRRDRPVTALRTRPDDRPSWIEVAVPLETQQRWRGSARSARLPVDVWVSLLLERSLIAEELGDSYRAVVEQAHEVLAVPRLPFGDARRRWIRQLTVGAPVTPDELPSLVLPGRLVARLAPAATMPRLVSLNGMDLSDARALELAAMASGLTMEAWAYRSALWLRRTGDAGDGRQ